MQSELILHYLHLKLYGYSISGTKVVYLFWNFTCIIGVDKVDITILYDDDTVVVLQYFCIDKSIP